MDTATDLVRWDVPFAEAHDPSVGLITEQGGDAAMLVVAPSGIERYPKYLVSWIFEEFSGWVRQAAKSLLE